MSMLFISKSFQYQSTSFSFKLLLKQVGILSDCKALGRTLSECYITAPLIFQTSQIELLCKRVWGFFQYNIFIIQLSVMH